MEDETHQESIPLKSKAQQPAMSSGPQEALSTYEESPSTEANARYGSQPFHETRYHRDFLGRPFRDLDEHEKCLSPYSGRLRILVVQSSSEVLQSESGALWFRAPLRNRSSWIIRVASWTLSRDHGSEDNVGTDVGTEALRWIPGCIALAIITSLPIQVAATPSNSGRYDPFLYKDWRYPLDARNKIENKRSIVSGGQGPHRVEIGRRVGPEYLCFVKDNAMQWSRVSEWTESRTDYVFISFTGIKSEGARAESFLDPKFLHDVGKHAANTVNAKAFWICNSCLTNLHEKDVEKKQEEKEQAIWTIADIVRGAKAVSIVVPGPLDAQLNGESLREWGTRVWTVPELLLYTEKHPILIYEKSKAKAVHVEAKLTGGTDGSPPTYIPDQPHMISRAELWPKVWSDPDYSGQLLDHYENSVILTPLELVTVALRCFHTRALNEYLDGDMSYALMGLLRQRPDVVRTDSAFQAFARLSLANDSNMFMERLICLLPQTLDDPWWKLDDAWGTVLWDIYPRTQVCGIGENDTIILDGCRGAMIRWDKFIPVLTSGQQSLRHRLLRYALRTFPAFFVIGLIWVVLAATLAHPSSNRSAAAAAAAAAASNAPAAPTPPSDDQISATLAARSDPSSENTNSASNATLGIGITLLLCSSLIVFLSPYLIHLVYRTKVHDSQPLFFGIEGYIDIYQLELLIFGSYEGRLQWSIASSPLSRHDLDKKGMKKDFFPPHKHSPSDIDTLMQEQNMFKGLDPVKIDPTIASLVQKSKGTSHHEKKIFTLVDTYTMTVTLFEAVRPPVAVLICGAEGGMQRALLCSQDWASGTLYRETVLRMETRVKDRMDTMARVRLGLNRDDGRERIERPASFEVVKGPWWKRFIYAVAERLPMQ